MNKLTTELPCFCPSKGNLEAYPQPISNLSYRKLGQGTIDYLLKIKVENNMFPRDICISNYNYLYFL